MAEQSRQTRRAAVAAMFVPLMKDLKLAQVAQQAQLPGSPLIPPEQALLALLALKQPLPQPVTFLLNLRKCAYHKELDRKELDRFFGVVSRQPVIRGITQSAVCQARHKLKPGAFLALNALLAF